MRNYSLLRSGTCPKCGKLFEENKTEKYHQGKLILFHDCGFRISDESYQEIIINYYLTKHL